jgi:hypothetical protein
VQQGIRNPSITGALLDLLDKPIAEADGAVEVVSEGGWQQLPS